MNLQTLALAFMAATAVGGVAWVFLYPVLSGEVKAEKRRAALARTTPAIRQVDRAQRSRREQIEESLREIEQRQKRDRKLTLNSRIAQAGLSWSKEKFLIVSGLLAMTCFAVPMVLGAGPIAAAGLAFAAGFGVPRWLLGFLKKRREAAFLRALPDAVDVIVRGIKAGLPLFESLMVLFIRNCWLIESRDDFSNRLLTLTSG